MSTSDDTRPQRDLLSERLLPTYHHDVQARHAVAASPGEPGQQRVRLAAGMLDTAVAAIGIAVLGLQLGGDDHALGWAGRSAPR
jgi:hypothetical protein